ncbi:hypothetical protein, partial [Roseomonas sp. BN140053]|uniref:hypothetical protein n=1 Tax=Roseomonas sp. BN140053 TaxID=3391898 RepID=UPI0039E92FE7
EQRVGRVSGRRGPRRGDSEATCLARTEVWTAIQLRLAVEAQNQFAQSVGVTGCALLPQWRRVFRGNWALDGRWYALGRDGCYQGLPPEDRAELRIGGEAVAELDVGASHLSVLRQLAGLPFLLDPYAIDGVPRAVVKRYVLECLGEGRPKERWSKLAKTEVLEVRGWSPARLRPLVLAVHPCLTEPARFVPETVAAGHSVPGRKLVSPFLVAREAAAMTAAMLELRAQGVLALPVHDSLVVPHWAAASAALAIRAGCLKHCGIDPVVRDKTGRADTAEQDLEKAPVAA